MEGNYRREDGNKLLIGAHLSIAGGYHNALIKAYNLNCSSLQMFLKNQRTWRMDNPNPIEIKQWFDAKNRLKNDIIEIIAHSNYLINLATDSLELREKSINSLRQELTRANLLGIKYYVLHPGSHKGQGLDIGIKLIAKHIDKILSELGKTPMILLETTAGSGNTVGGKIEELAKIIDHSKFPEKLGICLDTCHLFVSGYKIYLRNEYDKLMETIDRLIGIDKIKCIHMNDSAYRLSSHRDKHAHIGKGRLGIKPFWFIMQDDRLKNVPKIIETPKSPDGSDTWDKMNLSILTRLSTTPFP